MQPGDKRVKGIKNFIYWLNIYKKTKLKLNEKFSVYF